MAKLHLHNDLYYLRLGEERAEAEVSGPLLEIVEPNMHGTLLSCSAFRNRRVAHQQLPGSANREERLNGASAFGARGSSSTALGYGTRLFFGL